MVRQNYQKREDGLVEWRVRGKRRPRAWTLMDVPPSSESSSEKGRVPEGAVKARDTTTKTSDAPAGRKGGGKGDDEAWAALSEGLPPTRD